MDSSIPTIAVEWLEWELIVTDLYSALQCIALCKFNLFQGRNGNVIMTFVMKCDLKPKET